MCAHTARGCGDIKRANNIINEARSFARQSYDDMSGICFLIPLFDIYS